MFQRNFIKACLFLTAFSIFLFSCKTPQEEKNNENKTSADTSKIDKSIEELTLKINATPSDANLYHNRALLYIEQRNFQYAMGDVEKAIDIDSTKADYFITLSDLHFIANKTFQAKAALEKSISLDPQNIKARLKLAEIFFIVRKYQEAIDNLSAVLKIEPANTKALFMKGMIYKESGDTANAISTFQTVIDNDQNDYNAYMQLGVIYEAKANALAVQYFTGALRINPRSEEALYGRALYNQEHNELDKAIQDYTSIIQINPKNKNAHFNLGYLHYTFLKVYDQAIKHYDDAIAADSNYAEAYYNRGLCYEAVGNITAAAADYNKAINLRPGYELAALGMRRLKN